MSIFGGLLAGAGSLAGSLIASGDRKDSNKNAADIANKDREERKRIVNAGSTNAVGDTFGKFDPVSGSFKDTLSQPTQDIYSGIQGAGAAVGKQLPRLFDDLVTSGGAPGMTMDNARNAVHADNDRLFNSLVNPALNDAAVIGQRTQGGSSNQGNIVNRAMERLLPQIEYGTEKDIQDLFGGTRDNYLSYLNSLLGDAGKSAAALNPSTDTQDLVAMMSSVGNTATPAYVESPNIGNALATLGNTITTYGQENDAKADRDKMYQMLERMLGNQGNAGGQV